MGALFFCMGAGGPEKYEGRDMRTVHAGMNISERELIVCVRRSHLVVAAVIIHSGTHARKRVRPGKDQGRGWLVAIDLRRAQGKLG